MSTVPEELPLRELMLMLMGGEWRRRLANMTKTNDQLFGEYLNIIKASKSHKWYRETERLLGQYRAFLGQFPPNTDNFTQFFQRYNVPTIRQSTRARYYYVFSAFFRWYNGSSLPFKVKSRKPVPQSVSDEEVEKLKDAIRNRKTHKRLIDRDILIIELFCHTGLRRAELAGLRVRDLHLGGESPYLTVRQGKGGKDRTVNLNSYICSRLKSYVRNTEADRSVFGICGKTVATIFYVWAAKAGVPQLHPHSLRHKFATDILNRGGSLRDVQHLLGHESLGTTESYLAVTNDSLKKTVGLLAASSPRPAGARPGTEDSRKLEKMAQSLEDIRRKLGVEDEETGDGEKYFDLSITRDEGGEPADIRLDGEIPAAEVGRGLARFMSKHVKLRKGSKTPDKYDSR
jgi:site-specific recombinase XerD